MIIINDARRNDMDRIEEALSDQGTPSYFIVFDNGFMKIEIYTENANDESTIFDILSANDEGWDLEIL